MWWTSSHKQPENGTLFQYGTQDRSVIVQSAAVIHFFVLIIWFTNSFKSWYLSTYCYLSLGLVVQAKWTQRSTADLWDATSFEPAAWDMGSVPVFSTVHIIICWSICALLAVHLLCCYVPSLLIGPCWSKPDSKSINCIPPASVMVDIKNVFWAQS